MKCNSTGAYGTTTDVVVLPRVPFGKRLQAPQMPRYVVWSELLGREHTSIISAPDSFQARRIFATEHTDMLIVDCCARRIDVIDDAFRAPFPTFSLPVAIGSPHADLPRR